MGGPISENIHMLLALLRPLQQLHEAHGHRFVAGIDEAGVGAIAGPIVAAACWLPSDWEDGVIAADAKSMSRTERHEVFERIDADGCHACGIVDARSVDRLGTQSAVMHAMQVAATQLEAKLADHRIVETALFPFYLVDGEHIPTTLNGRTVVGGDRVEACIAAASIVASVRHEACMSRLARCVLRIGRRVHTYRDTHAHTCRCCVTGLFFHEVGSRVCAMWTHRDLPLWDFGVNAGWPSRAHLALVMEHGPSSAHRAGAFLILCVAAHISERAVSHPRPPARAGCFPFRRRYGRRIGHHPDRATVRLLSRCFLVEVASAAKADANAKCAAMLTQYHRVQGELSKAFGGAGDDATESGTAEEVARKERYREMALRLTSMSPTSRSASRRARRRERRHPSGRDR